MNRWCRADRRSACLCGRWCGGGRLRNSSGAATARAFADIYTWSHYVPVDSARVAVVAIILSTPVVVNALGNLNFAHLADHIAFIGIAVWAAIVVCIPTRAPDPSLLSGALRGTIFWLCLMLPASMMPLAHLPAAPTVTTLGLGFLSAVSDNIPRTKPALEQGGYAWAFLAYAVGLSGSMLWFGCCAAAKIAESVCSPR